MAEKLIMMPGMRRRSSRLLAALVALSLGGSPVVASAQAPVTGTSTDGALSGRGITTTSASAPTGSHDPSAQAAYADAQGLLRDGDLGEAVARLDLAVELAPQWSAPLKLRAEVLGKLAERYRPSEAYLSAQAADVERLLVIEPGVDTAERRHEVAVLRTQARDARVVEQKRRKLVKPAILVITASAALIASGGFMLGFIPSTSVDALYQRRYIYTGATMLALGVAMAVPAITLGVLAGRQGRRDSALAEFNVRTDRPQADIAVTPQFVPGGGGMGLRLRF